MKLTITAPISLNCSISGSPELTDSVVLDTGTEIEVVGRLGVLTDRAGAPVKPRRWVIPIRVDGLTGLCLYLDSFVRDTFPGLEIPLERE